MPRKLSSLISDLPSGLTNTLATLDKMTDELIFSH